MEITIHQNADHTKIQTVYAAVGYKGGVLDSDICFLASVNGQPVGAVRLCMENDVLVLRGMMVKQEFQRQGIGKALLNALDKHISTNKCYCINPQHLKDFYGRIGFQQVDADVAPAFFVERMLKDNTDGLDCITMLKLSSSR
jgi:predicted N-acetyltransferase YhbS